MKISNIKIKITDLEENLKILYKDINNNSTLEKLNLTDRINWKFNDIVENEYLLKNLKIILSLLEEKNKIGLKSFMNNLSSNRFLMKSSNPIDMIVSHYEHDAKVKLLKFLKYD